MLERRPALAGLKPVAGSRLRMSEAPDFALTQIAGLGSGFEDALLAIFAAVPNAVGIAMVQQGRTILRTGPSQIWIIEPEAGGYSALGAVTPLTSSRCRILIEGAAARHVLAKGIPLDLHPSAFGAGRFAMTGLHHTPVLLHCIDDQAFHLYALRTFARTVWDWLADAALEYAD